MLQQVTLGHTTSGMNTCSLLIKAVSLPSVGSTYDPRVSPFNRTKTFHRNKSQPMRDDVNYLSQKVMTSGFSTRRNTGDENRPVKHGGNDKYLVNSKIHAPQSFIMTSREPHM
ncbi:hypothetical protein HOLleu_38242 [Holothuria leucospilota]|uniref:Uncharacterized protein n=1 Tax=Holothuria leucospilota TaxID=206669 RepID=A0A9Q0YM35_HOLLE|nr:hypothetical protein HOLleu_38242 [Holothuria leucospilota]